MQIVSFLNENHVFLNNVASIITIICFCGTILDVLLDYKYKRNCEDKYGIPKELFNYNFFERLVTLVLSFIFIVLISTTFLFTNFTNAICTFLFQLFILYLCNILFIAFIGNKSPILNINNNLKTSDYFISPFFISLIEIILIMFTKMKGNDLVKVLIICAIPYITILVVCIFYGNRLKNNVKVININNIDYCLVSRVQTKCVLLEINKDDKCYYKGRYIIVDDNGLKFCRIDFDKELNEKFNKEI